MKKWEKENKKHLFKSTFRSKIVLDVKHLSTIVKNLLA